MSVSRRQVPEVPPALGVARARFDEPESAAKKIYECDACGEKIEGPPAGTGLFLWTRGDEVRYEEPPLCEKCASTIAIGTALSWEESDEE